jgi:hypothetical protein
VIAGGIYLLLKRESRVEFITFEDAQELITTYTVKQMALGKINRENLTAVKGKLVRIRIMSKEGVEIVPDKYVFKIEAGVRTIYRGEVDPYTGDTIFFDEIEGDWNLSDVEDLMTVPVPTVLEPSRRTMKGIKEEVEE